MPRNVLKNSSRASPKYVSIKETKAVVAKMSTSSSTPAISSDVAELKDMVRALILDRKNQTPASAPVKSRILTQRFDLLVFLPIQIHHANSQNNFDRGKEITLNQNRGNNIDQASTSGIGTLHGNRVFKHTNPKEDFKRSSLLEVVVTIRIQKQLVMTPRRILDNEHPKLLFQIKEIVHQKPRRIKLCEAKLLSVPIDEPQRLNSQDLPPHLEYDSWKE
ncbi:hypothetical protein Tco_1193434 [Tanacetum coccineum]